ncbi:MAG: NAD(P)/FAD-dependent oxidoreductase, partial [Alphaproteobacteria bacterium]
MPDTESLWNATAEAAPDCPALEGEAEADLAIVGAGYLGLSTALAAAAGGLRVRVLEAAEPGAGASGRNGGQVIPGIRHFPDELEAAFGADLGRRVYEFGLTTADAAFTLIDRHAIACDAVRTGWIQPADKPSALETSRRRAAEWRRRGHAARALDRDETIALTGTRDYIGGWIHEGGGSVQPLSYARGLARAATAAGAVVHGRSAVVAMARAGERWRLSTPAGTVVASRVL